MDAADDLNDVHLCIKCKRIITGLDNYLNHRRSNCIIKNNELLKIDKPKIDIHENSPEPLPPPPPVPQITTDSPNDHISICNDQDYHPIEHHHSDGLDNNHPVDQHDEQHSIENDGKNIDSAISKSLTINDVYDYNYSLGADIFFSSLELQSSSKLKLKNTTKGILTRKATAAIMANNNPQQDDIELITRTNSSGVESEKLLKAVNDISGSKKMVSSFGLLRYANNAHDSSPSGQYDEADVDDDDDEGGGGDGGAGVGCIGDGAEDYHRTSEQQHHDDRDDHPLLHQYHPPRSHTGGKWKPTDRQWNTAGGNNSAYAITTSGGDDSFDLDDFHPPPSYTKGKWIPGTKIPKLGYKSDPQPGKFFITTDQYWCNTCNRKLRSKILYDRHLRSNLHLKRTLPEKELDEASRSLFVSSLNSEKRKTKPSIYLNENIYATKIGLTIKKNKISRPSSQAPTATITSGEYDRQNKSTILEIDDTSIKPLEKPNRRSRKSNYIRCDICKMKFQKYLHGKHLISHYHYRRMCQNPNRSYDIILANIHRIVHQSPYQCQACHFYANTEEMFLLHWNTREHRDKTDGEGRFWCTFCKFECEDNNQMRRHLVAESHVEVIKAINRSVPIIIRKRLPINCEKCQQKFQYNIELKQHAKQCYQQENEKHQIQLQSELLSSNENVESVQPILLGTVSNKYQSRYFCKHCPKILKSRKALYFHAAKYHKIHEYFCDTCDMKFVSSVEAKRHRGSSQHKVNVAKKLNKPNLQRSCGLCSKQLDDVIQLKEHRRIYHPDNKYNCKNCGTSFILPQELTRHVRDKVCKDIHCVLKEEIELNEIPTTKPLNSVNDYSSFVSTEIRMVSAEQISQVIDMAKNIIPTTTNPDENLSSCDNVGAEELVETEVNITYRCSQCNFLTSSNADSIFHNICHKVDADGNSSDDKINCSLCDKKLPKSSLRLHLRRHTNERIYKCHQCSKSFIRATNLRSHIKFKHSTNSLTTAEPSATIQFNCTFCNKVFAQKNHLEQHLFCHRDKIERKIFPCPVPKCLFKGRFSSETKNHMLIHTNEKKISCPVDGCYYRGKTMLSLKRHSMVHIPEKEKLKNHQCNYCDFKTHVPGHLKRHILIHTGEKPYKCPHCDYGSNNSENLRKHILHTSKHPGRSIYECKHCNDDLTKTIKYATNSYREYNAHLIAVHQISASKS